MDFKSYEEFCGGGSFMSICHMKAKSATWNRCMRNFLFCFYCHKKTQEHAFSYFSQLCNNWAEISSKH